MKQEEEKRKQELEEKEREEANKKAEEAKKREDEENKKKAEEAMKKQLDEEKKKKEDEEKRAAEIKKQEDERKKKELKEAEKKKEAEEKQKYEEEKQKQEEEKRKMEKNKAEEEARNKEEERKQKEEADKQKKEAEEEKKRKEQEAKQKKEDDTKKKKEEEEKKQKEKEAKQKKEEETKKRKEEEEERKKKEKEAKELEKIKKKEEAQKKKEAEKAKKIKKTETTNELPSSSSFAAVANKPLPPPPSEDGETKKEIPEEIETNVTSQPEMTVEQMQKMLDEQDRLREERKITNKSNWETSEREKIASYLRKKDEILAPVEDNSKPSSGSVSGRKKISSVPEASIKEWNEMKDAEKLKKTKLMEENNRKRLEADELAKNEEAEHIRNRLKLLDEIQEEEVIEFTWEDVTDLHIEGFMDKQNTKSSTTAMLTTKWRTRWFLLQDNNLIYYRDKQQHVLGKNCPPDGVINLYSTTAIEPVDPQNGIFKISTPDQPYLLSAYDQASMDIWLKYLRKTRNFYLGQKELLSSAPIASKDEIQQSGPLEKLCRFNKWKTRWFVLRDGVLFRYNNKVGVLFLFFSHKKLIILIFIKGGEQLGKFPLYKAELSEYRPEKMEGRCFQLRDAKQLQTLVLRAKDVEEMHHWLNNILKQKVLIEETINSIIIE